MRDEQAEIDKARRRLAVERHNSAVSAAARETILNSKELEINAWEKAQKFADRAQARADEMRFIVHTRPIEIVKFSSDGKVWKRSYTLDD